MKLEQLSIFLENKAGRMAEVTKVLADAGINIMALALADTSDFGILRLVVSDTERAAELLKSAGFTVSRTVVVGVQMSDVPGGLNGILQALASHNINIEYMYPFVRCGRRHATMIFRLKKADEAIAFLRQQGIPLLDAAAINGC